VHYYDCVYAIKLTCIVYYTTVHLTKVYEYVIWSMVMRLHFLAQAILFDENNELMAIVNGNVSHYYCFSNAQRSILK